jgi:guanine deaminase
MPAPDHEHFMRLAVAAARAGIAAGQAPFGACVVRDGVAIATVHNTIARDWDPSAHAEVNAVRAACRALQTVDLSDCTLYTTGESCRMCFACCQWARLGTLVYGATVADAAAVGFSELHVPNRELAAHSERPITVIGEVARDACRALFSDWAAQFK